MSERSKVRLQAALMLVAGVPINALARYFSTGEAFGPSFVGSTIALVVLVALVIALPEPFTRREVLRRRWQIWQNRVAWMVVLGVVLGVLLVWASAYLLRL